MFDQATKDKIRAAFVKMGIDIPAKKVEPTKLEDVKLLDGTMLSVDKMEVGASAQFIGADGVAVPAEGEYELEDGTKVICAAGLITEIKPKEVETPAPNPNAEMAATLSAITSRLEAIEKSYSQKQTSLEAQLSETKKALSVALEAIDKIDENAVAINLESQKDKKKVELKYEDMTNAQKVKFNRGKEI